MNVPKEWMNENKLTQVGLRFEGAKHSATCSFSQTAGSELSFVCLWANSFFLKIDVHLKWMARPIGDIFAHIHKITQFTLSQSVQCSFRRTSFVTAKYYPRFNNKQPCHTLILQFYYIAYRVYLISLYWSAPLGPILTSRITKDFEFGMRHA